MKKITLYLLIIISNITHAKIIEIYKTSDGTSVGLNKLVANLPAQGYFVLGEFHNTTEIQAAQAELISSKVQFENRENDFNIHWEFLNYTDQNKTNSEWDRYQNNLITSTEFIKRTAGKQNLSYTPIIETTKLFSGNLHGINLPRSIKQKVIKDGIQSIDPKYIPYHHYVGASEYKERFIQAMGGHAPPDIIEKYFLVQCLTDSVMADQIAKSVLKPINFIIAGSFHTDFYDATVVRLKKLVTYDIITFKFISKNSSSAKEIENYKAGDKDFGQFADYIIITE